MGAGAIAAAVVSGVLFGLLMWLGWKVAGWIRVKVRNLLSRS